MIRRTLALTLPLALVVGCVSKKKYQSLETDYAALQADYDQLQGRYATLERDFQRLHAQVAQMGEQGVVSMETATYYQELLDQLKPYMERGEVEVTLRGNRMVIGLSDEILFDFAEADVLPGGRTLVGDLASIIDQDDDFVFQVEGHTDTVPVLPNAPWDNNWDLGAQRALNVLDLLTQRGIDEDRLSAATYGETDPVASNATEQGRQLNRRVNVVIQPDLSRIDGSLELVQAAARADALVVYPDFERTRLKPAPQVAMAQQQQGEQFEWPSQQLQGQQGQQAQQQRQQGIDTSMAFTPNPRNDLYVALVGEQLTFRFGPDTIQVKVDPDEVADELKDLFDELDQPQASVIVTEQAHIDGDDIDDEVAALLEEALDEDTQVYINGVLIPGDEVDEEVGEYFAEMLDGQGDYRLTMDEIDDEIRDLWDEIEEQRRTAEREGEEF